MIGKLREQISVLSSAAKKMMINQWKNLFKDLMAPPVFGVLKNEKL